MKSITACHPLWRAGWRRAGAAVLCGGAVSLAATGAAFAEVECSSLPNPVLGVGGSAQKPLLGRLGRVLANLDTPRTLIYAAPGACNGPYALRDDTLFSGNASYWDASGAELTCTVSAPGDLVDFAVMGNTFALCPDSTTPLPDDIGVFSGPVGTVNVFVPVASSEQSISSEAFYFAYGFGAAGQADPWIDESVLIRRDENSFVQLYLALASGIPVTRFRGVDAQRNSRSVDLVAGAADPDAAIGFASGEVADANRDRIRTLAWQQEGQTCGYWPDSTATSFDKANVRNGQYYLWGAANFFARVDGSGEIENETARIFIGWLTGDVAPPSGVNILEEIIENGNIPQCAMEVARDGDLGPIYSFQPEEPCGCYFEFAATGETDCTPCTSNSDCSESAPTCRHGFCEVQ